MDKNIPDYFGAILHRVRKGEGRSLKDLAELLGKDENGKYNITPSYINRLEKGEKENPSFKLVCLMIEKLGLNPVEVFKSFGFEDILNKKQESESNDIKDIIRVANIKVPINEKGDIKNYLTQEEKECLIYILETVLSYSICNDETYYLGEILGGVYRFKGIRERCFETEIEINGEIISVCFSAEIKNELDLKHISINEICDFLIELGSKLLKERGNFTIVYEEIGVILLLEIYEKNFYIKQVLDNIEYK